MEKLVLYHGSTQVVPKPTIEKCRSYNDYGKGFYCTADKGLAFEWACQKGTDGIVNQYELSLQSLNVVDLTSPPYSTLHWLEVLLVNRLVRLSTPTMQLGDKWLKENFAVNLDDADVVYGYRADDSYFSFARGFLRNEITFFQLERALTLGDLGTQYMVKSPHAFAQLRFIGCEPADASLYWPQQVEREDKACWEFAEMLASQANSPASTTANIAAFVNDSAHANDLALVDNLYLSDLMRLEKDKLYACLR